MPPTINIKPSIRFVFIALLLAQTISAFANIQLFQDGGSYLFEILQTKSAAIRHDRFTAIVFQTPTILLIKFLIKFFHGVDENIYLIRLVFCFAYAMVPIISLGLCWLLVRKNNEQLFIWPAITILFINLVNFSGVSELLIAMQLCCPLVVGFAMNSRSKFFLLLLFITTPIIFFLHPLVAVYFAVIAMIVLYIGYINKNIRVPLWRIGVAFLFLAFLRLILSVYKLTEYESSFFNSEEGNSYLFHTSIENKILLISSILIGVNCLLNKYNTTLKVSASISLKVLYRINNFIAFASGIFLVAQYGYRDFPLKTGLAIFASIIIFLMLAVDSVKKVTASELFSRNKLVSAFSIIFLLVVLCKTFVWQISIKKLVITIAKNSDSCIELDNKEFNWIKTNPYRIIDTWALPSLAFIIQDDQERKLLLEKGNCSVSSQSDVIRFDEWTAVPKKYLTPSFQKK